MTASDDLPVAEKICTKCGKAKPLTEFTRDASRDDGFDPRCKACNAERRRQYAAGNREQDRDQQRQYREANRALLAERSRQYRTENREQVAEGKRRYREENREQVAEAKQKYEAEHREEIRVRKQEYYDATREYQLARKRQHRLENPDLEREQDRLYRDRIKAVIFGHYGERCACCGSTERLEVDHVNGDGATHREKLFGDPRGGQGLAFYRWIIANNFPADLQTLCKPCNSSKQAGEQCRLAHDKDADCVPGEKT